MREGWREEARAVFEELGDEYGLAAYWWSTSMEVWFGLRAQETAEACERALEQLERSGRSGSRLATSRPHRLIASFVYVPLPVDDSIERIRALGAGQGRSSRRGSVGSSGACTR